MENHKNLILKVKQLISKNRTGKALETLAKAQLSELDKDIIILNSRFSKVREDQRLGLIDEDQAQVKMNKINRDLLDLSEKIEKKVNLEENRHVSSNQNKHLNYKKWGILIILLAIVISFFFIWERIIEPRSSVTSIEYNSLGRNYLIKGESLEMGQYLESEDTLTRLVFQHNGNLELWKHDIDIDTFKIIWEPNTENKKSTKCRFTERGSLALSNNDSLLFKSKSEGLFGKQLVLENDGDLVVKNTKGEKIWTKNTRNIIRHPKFIDPNKSYMIEHIDLNDNYAFQIVSRKSIGPEIKECKERYEIHLKLSNKKSNTQRFKFKIQNDSLSYRISTNDSLRNCLDLSHLDIKGESLQDGGILHLWKYLSGENQNFILEKCDNCYLGEGLFNIKIKIKHYVFYLMYDEVYNGDLILKQNKRKKNKFRLIELD